MQQIAAMEKSIQVSSTAHGTNVLIPPEVLWFCLPREHPYGSGGPRGDGKLIEDGDGVISYRVRAQEESLRNLLVRIAFYQKPEHGAFFLA